MISRAFGVPVLSSFTNTRDVPWGVHLFFFYAARQALFWIPALVALVVGQLWSERRFAQLEP